MNFIFFNLYHFHNRIFILIVDLNRAFLICYYNRPHEFCWRQHTVQISSQENYKLLLANGSGRAKVGADVMKIYGF